MFFRALPGFLALIVTSGCADFPRDPENTLERVRAESSFRVGIVAPGADAPELDQQALLLGRVAEATGAEPRIVTGPSDRLVARLEEGEIDLVIGEFANDSPWRSRVTMLPPLEARDERDRTQLTVAARNGENAWIGLLYREGQAIREGGS